MPALVAAIPDNGECLRIELRHERSSSRVSGYPPCLRDSTNALSRRVGCRHGMRSAHVHGQPGGCESGTVKETQTWESGHARGIL